MAVTGVNNKVGKFSRKRAVIVGQTPDSDKLRCLDLRVNSFRQLEQFMRVRVETGTGTMPLELNLAAADRIKAEIDVLKFKEELSKAKK